MQLYERLLFLTCFIHVDFRRGVRIRSPKMTQFSALIAGLLMLTASGITVLDGVYSEAQAKRGQTAFLEKCASCHGQNLEGTNGSAVEVDGSPLVGTSFIENWREDDLGELFKFIQTSMPREAAATASDAEKLDILAFILQRNEFPAGTSDLTADSVGKIMLLGKGGPKPLPSMTAIRAVGCLLLTSPGAWNLSRASEPARTRNPEEIQPDELKSATSQPLGSLTFKLPKLDFAIPGIK